MKTLSDSHVKEKLVLLRVDINADVIKRKIVPSQRFIEATKTIKKLKIMGAKIVVIAHQGNPGKKDFISLEQHARILNKNTSVKFVKDILGKTALKEIRHLRGGEALLLENIRFEKDEFSPDKKDNKLTSILCPLFDFYVNDAFSVMHRSNTSIVSFPKKIKNSMIGLSAEKEVKALEKISLKDCLYILGGAKPESDIKLLGKNKVLAGGFFGQMCLNAKGKKLGFQDKYVRKETLVNMPYNKFIEKLRPKLSKVVLPVDFAINRRGRRFDVSLERFPLDYRIDDIGPETIQIFKEEIAKAKNIYMKGPLGKSFDKNFSKGTVEILRAVADSKAFSVIGGGHLSVTADKNHIHTSKFGHLSSSGGALLSFIAKEKLPGLKALGYYGKK